MREWATDGTSLPKITVYGQLDRYDLHRDAFKLAERGRTDITHRYVMQVNEAGRIASVWSSMAMYELLFVVFLCTALGSAVIARIKYLWAPNHRGA